MLALIGQGGQAPIPLLHLSTAYVCGERSGPVAEGELDVGQRFANGYESSKAEAERLVRAAQQQGGISAVARPSIVVGRYRDGTIGQFTNIYALIRLVTAGRTHIVLASPCASLDLVPIDHVIGGLTDIAERMAAASGRTYHLVSGAPVPVAALRTLALVSAPARAALRAARNLRTGPADPRGADPRPPSDVFLRQLPSA